MSRSSRLVLALVAAVLCAPAVAGPAFAAGSDPGPVVATDAPGPVIATDPIAAVPAAVMVGVDANVVEGLSVTGHAGKKVTVTTGGQSPRSITAPAAKAAVFRHLTPGKAYVVAIAGVRVATATPVAQVTAATGLVVRASTIPGQVDLTWQHTATKVTGAPRISYDITATPITDSPARTTAAVTGTASTTAASLSGLDRSALYTITVTPRNSAGAGKPTAATMTQSLAQITGSTVPTTPAAPIPASVPATPTPSAPAPAPTPGPAPAPGPSTKTIYVCPAGFPENGAGVCEKTAPYTFQAVTVDSPYTYHQQFVKTGTQTTDKGTDWSGTTCPNFGTLYVDWTGAHCWETVDTGYYISAKDVPPTGFTDSGTTYTKTDQVKDTLPVGWLDNGTSWVQTTAKVATVVPA